MPLPEDPVAAVKSDVESVFAEAFPDGEFEVPRPFNELAPIGGADAVVVPWLWRGTQTGDFREVRRTGLRVEFAGTTIVTETEEEGVLFHRIVDWLTMYRQLGLLMVCRRPRTAETDEIDDSDVAAVPAREG